MIRQDKRALDADRKAICTRISARLSAARRQFEASGTALPDWFCDLARDIRNTLRRAVPALDTLSRMEDRLGQVLPDDSPAVPSDPEPLPDNATGDAGQSVRHSDSKEKEIYKHPAPTITEIWQTCPTLSEYYPAPPTHERDLLKRIHDICGFLGLKPATRNRMAEVLGLPGIARCLDDLAARISGIERPDAYVASMLKRLESRNTAGRVRARYEPCYDRGHSRLRDGL